MLNLDLILCNIILYISNIFNCKCLVLLLLAKDNNILLLFLLLVKFIF